jgi:hypothetical protein
MVFLWGTLLFAEIAAGCLIGVQLLSMRECAALTWCCCSSLLATELTQEVFQKCKWGRLSNRELVHDHPGQLLLFRWQHFVRERHFLGSHDYLLQLMMKLSARFA